MCMKCCSRRGHGKTCRSQFSSTMWAPEIKLRLFKLGDKWLPLLFQPLPLRTVFFYTKVQEKIHFKLHREFYVYVMFKKHYIYIINICWITDSFKIKLFPTLYFSYLQLPTCKILFTFPSVSWIYPFSFPRFYLHSCNPYLLAVPS